MQEILLGRKVAFSVGGPGKAGTLDVEPRLGLVGWGGYRESQEFSKSINFKEVLNEMNFKFNFTKNFFFG